MLKVRSHICLCETKLNSVTKLCAWTDFLNYSKTLVANVGYTYSIWTERKRRGIYLLVNEVKRFLDY